MDPRAYWVGFNRVKGIGAVRFRALLDFFGSAELAWQAPAEAYLQAGLSAKVVENLLNTRQSVDLAAYWEKIQAAGIAVLTWEDAEYPRRLREVDQSPPVLYLRGEISLADEWAVAIVGTRGVSAYGRQAAQDLAACLAQNGITVVSGLARGVDGEAHNAALEAGGRTLAVLGCGVDRIYPPEHRKLAERILRSGAVLSDYAPGTEPESSNFPPRNRIISGLSLATVVIEAGTTSGALITATFAVEQGREVFAVPGSIYSPLSKGPNQLIQQGARPLLRPEDVLDALNLKQVQEYRAVRIQMPEDPVESGLLRTLDHEPLHIDEISARSGLPIAQVSATLTLLELKGLVRQVGGMNYVAIRERLSTYQAGRDES